MVEGHGDIEEEYGQILKGLRKTMSKVQSAIGKEDKEYIHQETCHPPKKGGLDPAR